MLLPPHLLPPGDVGPPQRVQPQALLSRPAHSYLILFQSLAGNTPILIKNSGFERKNAPCSRGPQELLLVHSWVPLDLKDPVQTPACEHYALK
jgi:hypothetical protein